MTLPPEADIAAAWAAYEVFLEHLVTEGRLTPEMFTELRSEDGKEAWFWGYCAEYACLMKWTRP